MITVSFVHTKKKASQNPIQWNCFILSFVTDFLASLKTPKGDCGLWKSLQLAGHFYHLLTVLPAQELYKTNNPGNWTYVLSREKQQFSAGSITELQGTDTIEELNINYCFNRSGAKGHSSWVFWERILDANRSRGWTQGVGVAGLVYEARRHGRGTKGRFEICTRCEGFLGIRGTLTRYTEFSG